MKISIKKLRHYPSGSDSKESACNTGTWSGKNPWRRARQPTPVFLPGEFYGHRSLASYSLWGRKESDTTERLTLSLYTRKRKPRKRRQKTAQYKQSFTCLVSLKRRPTSPFRTNTVKDVLSAQGTGMPKQEVKSLEQQANLALEYKTKQGKAAFAKSFAKRTHWSQKIPLPTPQEMTLHMDVTRWSIPV